MPLFPKAFLTNIGKTRDVSDALSADEATSGSRTMMGTQRLSTAEILHQELITQLTLMDNTYTHMVHDAGIARENSKNTTSILQEFGRELGAKKQLFSEPTFDPELYRNVSAELSKYITLLQDANISRDFRIESIETVATFIKKAGYVFDNQNLLLSIVKGQVIILPLLETPVLTTHQSNALYPSLANLEDSETPVLTTPPSDALCPSPARAAAPPSVPRLDSELISPCLRGAPLLVPQAVTTLPDGIVLTIGAEVFHTLGEKFLNNKDEPVMLDVEPLFNLPWQAIRVVNNTDPVQIAEKQRAFGVWLGQILLTQPEVAEKINQERWLENIQQIYSQHPEMAQQDRSWCSSCFQTALVLNSPQLVQRLIEIGIDPKGSNSQGNTPLMLAAYLNRPECIRVLLNKKYQSDEINVVGSDGMTALHYAVLGQDMDSVRALCTANPNYNMKNSAGQTAFMLAVQVENVDLVKELLPKVTKVSVQAGDALLLAAEKGHIDILSYLLEAKVPVTRKNCPDPLHVAIRSGQIKAVKMLLDGGGKEAVNRRDETNQEKQTPLMLACATGNLEIVKQLIDGGADWNAKDINGETVLIKVIKEDKPEIFNYLLGRKRDLPVWSLTSSLKVDAADNSGKTALIHAALAQKAQYISPLIKALKGNQEAVDKDGRTALMYALQKGDIRVVEALVGGHIDINKKDNEGNGLLHYAVMGDNEDCIICLLNINIKRIKIDSKNKAGITPFMLAVDEGKSTSMGVLKKHQANINMKDKEGNTPLLRAIKNRRVDMIIPLGNLGANMNMPNAQERSPLYVAISISSSDWKSVVSDLLKAGADINHPACKEGYPVLFMLSNPTDAEWLIEQGASPSLLNWHGETVFWAIVNTGNMGMLTFYKDKGVDINAQNDQGQTVLMELAKLPNAAARVGMARELLKLGAKANPVDKNGRTALIVCRQ